jgi:phage terminase small subunit
MQLTGKQQKFLEAYLANGRNGAAAYRAAYQTNASNQRAAEEASRLLRHPKIAPKIDKAERRAHRAVERVLDRYVVSEERVTEALAKIGFLRSLDFIRFPCGA